MEPPPTGLTRSRALAPPRPLRAGPRGRGSSGPGSPVTGSAPGPAPGCAAWSSTRSRPLRAGPRGPDPRARARRSRAPPRAQPRAPPAWSSTRSRPLRAGPRGPGSSGPGSPVTGATRGRLTPPRAPPAWSSTRSRPLRAGPRGRDPRDPARRSPAPPRAPPRAPGSGLVVDSISPASGRTSWPGSSGPGSPVTGAARAPARAPPGLRRLGRRLDLARFGQDLVARILGPRLAGHGRRPGLRRLGRRLDLARFGQDLVAGILGPRLAGHGPSPAPPAWSSTRSRPLRAGPRGRDPRAPARR